MAAKGNILTQSHRVTEKVRLGDVCTPLKGVQINGSELSDKFGYPFLNGGVEPSGQWRDFNVSGGTVTISEGGNSCGFVNYMEDNFWCGAHCYYLSDPRCDSKYLFHSLKAKQKEIQALRTGVCMPNIKKSVISNFEIKYHSEVGTQKRIAAVLDKICELKKNAEAQIENLDLLVKSRFVEMFGSSDYDEVTIGEVVDRNISSAKRVFSSSSKIKYIDISSIDNIRNVVSGYREYVFAEAPSRAQQYIQYGDILVSTVRPNLKNVAVTPFHDDNLVASSGFCVLRAVRCLPEYLMTVVCSNEFTSAMIKVVNGANYPAIKDSDVLNYVIKLPPIKIQTKFAAFVEKVEKLKDVAKKSVEEMDTLYRAKLQEYFG